MNSVPPNHESLRRSVQTRHDRQRRWEREGERPLAKNLAMIGSLGWLIAIPTVAGAFLGRWLDHSFGTGIMFTAALIFVGAIIGGALAWKRMHQE